jgi:metallo-beta-lactamase class B
MKFLMVVMMALSIHSTGFSQPGFERIKIARDLELIRLSENAYVHVSISEVHGYGQVSSNGLIFIDGGEAYLFDTPMTEALTQDLIYWFRDSMNLKIVGFVPNHWHDDCMGGLAFIKKSGIESWANQMTIEIAKTNGLPLPDHGFKDSLELNPGNKKIECFYFGAAHSMDNIVVWIPSEQILFAGCMIKSTEWQNLGNTADGDLVAYPETIRKVISKFPNAKIVIPGHGQVGGLELLYHTKNLLRN